MERPLSESEVLIFDCQATGVHPRSGFIIEAGWKIHLPADCAARQGIRAYCVQLPPGKQIPPNISRITGIYHEDCIKGISPSELFSGIRESALEVVNVNNSRYCPLVIHFSRYEQPFLAHLIAKNPGEPFPKLEIFCTHEISRRLIPSLPRYGLRAIAGYFGYSVHEMRRSGYHVSATAVIWNNLVRILKEEHNVETFSQLRKWIFSTGLPQRKRKIYPMDSSKRLQIPDNPGIYRMLRSNGDILYIGKATSLKKRVNSYFQKQRNHSEKLLEMLTQVQDIDFTVTDTALEAAMLESDEIKKLSPQYNSALKGERRNIVYFSQDLEHYRKRPDKKHYIGPVPRPDDLECFPAVRKILSDYEVTRFDVHFPRKLLGIPKKAYPELYIFLEGIEQFKKSYADEAENNPLCEGIFYYAKKLWLEHKENTISEQADEETGKADEASEGKTGNSPSVKPVWTPDTVASAIKGRLMMGFRTLLRARVLTLLSQSVICWNKKKERNKKVFLAVDRTEIFAVSRNMAKEKSASPTYFFHSGKARKECFTAASYDRMRILTTELKRLTSENRLCYIQVSKKKKLYPDAVCRFLRLL